MILVDFEKAFDFCNYKSIYNCLKYFGYSKNFVNMFKILFTNFELCMTNAGHISEVFYPTHGLFQGNPVGPYGFLCLVKTLAIQLCKNTKIQSISINGIKCLLSQFVDDLSLFLKLDKTSWQEVLETFDSFYKNSGLKVNYDKTMVYRMGSIRNTNAKFYSSRKIVWTNEPMNILGVWVTDNEELCNELNYSSIIEKCKTLIKMWQNRGLSIMGKTMVINSLIVSRFVYRLMVLRKMPKQYLSTLQSVISNFLWNNGKAKIPWGVLTLPSKLGGISLVNIKLKDIALKVQWAIKIQEDKTLRILAYQLLQNKYGNNIWEANLNSRDVIMMFDTQNFWGDALLDWSELKFNKGENVTDVLSQPLFLNSYIRVNDKPCYFSRAIEGNLKSIFDIVIEKKIATYPEIIKKFGPCISILEYNSLVAAIPKEWKIKIKEETGNPDEPLVNKLRKCSRVTPVVTNMLNYCCKNKMIDQANKWNKACGTSLETDKFIRLLCNGYKYTISTKLCSFHYKLLNKAILTNT